MRLSECDPNNYSSAKSSAKIVCLIEPEANGWATAHPICYVQKEQLYSFEEPLPFIFPDDGYFCINCKNAPYDFDKLTLSICNINGFFENNYYPNRSNKYMAHALGMEIRDFSYPENYIPCIDCSLDVEQLKEVSSIPHFGIFGLVRSTAAQLMVRCNEKLVGPFGYTWDASRTRLSLTGLEEHGYRVNVYEVEGLVRTHFSALGHELSYVAADALAAARVEEDFLKLSSQLILGMFKEYIKTETVKEGRSKLRQLINAAFESSFESKGLRFNDEIRSTVEVWMNSLDAWNSLMNDASSKTQVLHLVLQKALNDTALKEQLVSALPEAAALGTPLPQVTSASYAPKAQDPESLFVQLMLNTDTKTQLQEFILSDPGFSGDIATRLLLKPGNQFNRLADTIMKNAPLLKKLSSNLSKTDPFKEEDSASGAAGHAAPASLSVASCAGNGTTRGSSAFLPHMLRRDCDLPHALLPQPLTSPTHQERSSGVESSATLIRELKAQLMDERTSKKDQASRYEASISELQQQLAQADLRFETLQSSITDAGYNSLDEWKQDVQHTRRSLQQEREDIAQAQKKVDLTKESIISAVHERMERYSNTPGMIAELLDRDLMHKLFPSTLSTNRRFEFNSTPCYGSPEEQKDVPSTAEKASMPLRPFDSQSSRLVLAQNLITNVARYLDKSGRRTSAVDVANYLICFTQGFVTTFAGRPGSGKTSLCNLLGKALGLQREDSFNRFVDVAVSRGWMSYKDLIGYYNPLSGEMVKSNAAVYDALQQASLEAGREDCAPLVILLDEANLSSIEHYWSIFLKNSDLDSPGHREYTLGGDQASSWKIPQHLRFITTVNFDHTTEELSPRFLDRSWVIIPEVSPYRPADICFTELPEPAQITSYAELEAAFRKPARELPTPAAARLLKRWGSIEELLQECELPVMYRSRKMIQDYLSVAADLMTDEPNTALDFAISQKLLPTLSGSGENYKVCLAKLTEACSDLPRTLRLLQNMKKTGDRLSIYQFFTY